MGSVVSWLNDICEDDELGANIAKSTKVCGLYRGYIYLYVYKFMYKHIYKVTLGLERLVK